MKYCNDECNENHREQHEEECRKRKTELRDRDLFTLPDSSYLGECPICCLPQPIGERKCGYSACCSKYICNGCDHANQKREIEAGLEHRCAFCREPLPRTQKESFKRASKRIKNNDPVAMQQMGQKRREEGDYESALKYLTKAAELGDADAHYNLSCMYHKGEGVEKDEKKHIYHLEEPAIGGHLVARHNLGIHEWNNGRYERAVKHSIIAANLGYNDSLKVLMKLYAEGHATKQDYANAMRAYQATVAATKSSQRDEAERYQELYHNFVAAGSRRKMLACFSLQHRRFVFNHLPTSHESGTSKHLSEGVPVRPPSKSKIHLSKPRQNPATPLHL